MIRTVLTRDLPTRIGTFAAGLPVTVLAIKYRQVKLCLDSPHHLPANCHVLWVPSATVRGVHLRQNKRDRLPEIDCAVTA